jgi:acetolactate synthase I/II/III large subunit
MTDTVAQLVADFLAQQGVRRIFGLCGGHIQPMWDAAWRRGIEVIDVRHEGAAVMMAHASAELTETVAVAMVTAGPGVTNAVTGIANAFVSGVPLVVLSGRTPRPQTGMGAMQDIPQAALLQPICQSVQQLWHQRQVVGALDAAFASALGVHGRPGPVYVDLPVDMQEEAVEPPYAALPARVRRHEARPPRQEALIEAAQLIAESRRMLVIAGRSARAARKILPRFLDQTDSLFLDSADARGVLSADNGRYVPAVRGKVIAEADLVVTLGRRLDFQLAYGSPAVFNREARFLRIGEGFLETGENRPGDVEVRGDVGDALRGLVQLGTHPKDPDDVWLQESREQNHDRAEHLRTTIAEAPVGGDGRMHPYRLIDALNKEVIDEETIVVADGGDILSFARVALHTPTYLDCGPLGCLGVGIPFAVGASLALPGRPSVALIGDGSFGFLLGEVDTAVRHQAQAMFVVANNEGWNIERHDQRERYDGDLVGVDLPGCRYDLVARGLGAHGEFVEHEEELCAALARARDNLPAVVNVMVTRDAISPDFRSGLASVPSHQALDTWNKAELALTK